MEEGKHLNIVRCPVCGSEELELFYQKGQVPVHQNMLINDYQMALAVPRGNIELNLCLNCSFIYNSAFDFDLMQYHIYYDNNQDCSPFFQSYVKDIIDYLQDDLHLQNQTIIEVGCGQGTFLKTFIETAGGTGYGFDPAYKGPKTTANAKITFIQDYYGPKYKGISADLIICRHVIEHIEKPLDLLTQICGALKNSPQAVVFLETPSVEWILKNTIIYDFFYEHCSYFNMTSLDFACQKAGFNVIDKREVFNDQYMWFKARVKNYESEPLKCIEINRSIRQLALLYSGSEKKIETLWLNKLAEFHKDGKLAIWGAGAKGVTFLNLIDPLRKYIDCAIDLNPNKQGKYIAGTGHPIYHYEALRERNIKTIIVMNANYMEEISMLLKYSGVTASMLAWEA